ncbi:hypothetical protein CON06_08025 [Bacillus cereus]|nr:hypothetical protein CON06_08025 [Bacillus cereus]
MKELINKLDSDNFKTQGQISELKDGFEAYIKFYDRPQEENAAEEKSKEESTVEEKQNVKSVKRFNSITRGDVYFTDLSSVVGSEQGGIRPVVVIQNGIANRFAPTVTVAPITSQIQKAKLPTHVEVDAKRNGMQRDAVILLEQIRTIDKERLKDKITRLDDNIMEKVDDALLIQLGLAEF